MAEPTSTSDILVAAITAGDVEAVRTLVARGALGEWEYGDSPLGLAAEAGQVEVVRLLLDAGIAVDAEDDDDEGGPGGGRTALSAAAAADEIAAARLLIERGANVNHPSSPLANAAYSLEMTRLLVEAGADPDQEDAEGRPVVLYAVDAGQPEVVQFLADAAGWEKDESLEELLESAREAAAEADDE
jgi:ankyrin repeat protein